MTTVIEAIKERDERYGRTPFLNRARISQELKRTVRTHEHQNRLSIVEREALDMILHKIARIVGGEKNREDSWLDIAGYAELVLREVYKHEDTDVE